MASRQTNIKRFVGVVAFVAIGVVLYQLVSALLSPYQRTSIMTDKANSFYSEPKNTIEVIFLGSSSTSNAYIPAQLYEDYGVCSYNLATSAQPFLAALTLTEDTYWAHPRTLDTVVLDCSTLFYEPADPFYRVVLDEVSLPSKLFPVLGWEEAENDKGVYLSNTYAYHNRWSELDETDIDKFSYQDHPYLRGYEPLWARSLTEGDVATLSLPKVQPDLTATPAEANPVELRYLRELAKFCRDRDITLVLAKTPVYDEWPDGNHVATAHIAESLGVDFLDLNYEPFFSETGFNQALDTRDGYHPNDSGARKITRYVGDYLVERGLVTGMDPGVDRSFMDEQAADYHAVTDGLDELRSHIDPVDYLAYAMEDPNYTIFLGIDGEGTAKLTQDQRDRLDDLGLSWFASVEPGQSYRAIITDGHVVDEDLAARPDRRLLTCYTPEMLVEPKHPYFKMFESSDREAMEALQYAEDPENAPKGEWCFVDPGLTVICYDNELQTVADRALFRAGPNLMRYCDPEPLLEQYLAAGAEDYELPWYLWQLKLYNERLAAAGLPTGGHPATEAVAVPQTDVVSS